MQNQQFAQPRLHTPTQSISEGGQVLDPIAGSAGAAGAATGSKTTANWNDKKFREEYDLARAKLSDQKFNMRDYEDPLLPRQHPQSKYYPNGVTAELEAHLQAVIANAKASSE
ncbi:hypothetical protein F4775DRAFT_556022 [Biscogniauxia sp. FL1348]|nr:hypothetical protein F4775DRAFT_556022 [Biscogniauxia sp. FL1348]